MKITSFDEHAFKRAAKLLSQQAPTAGVSACQDSLARAAGYRDYHEIRQLLNKAGYPRVPASNTQQVDVVSALSAALTVNPGDVIDIFCRARFFGPVAMDPDDAITLREKLYEKNQFPQNRKPQGGLEPLGLVGKICIKGRPTQRGILVEKDSLTIVMSDYDINGSVAKHEFQYHREPAEFFIPLRCHAVYGMWEEDDGSKVLFSRDYCPLWKIIDGQVPMRDDPFRWVNFTSQIHYFPGGSFRGGVEHVRGRSADVLREFRIQSVPRLVEYLPELIASKKSIHDIKNGRSKKAT